MRTEQEIDKYSEKFLKKHRIIKCNGKYFPQYKFLFFWLNYTIDMDVSIDLSFDSASLARSFLDDELEDWISEKNVKKIIPYYCSRAS